MTKLYVGNLPFNLTDDGRALVVNEARPQESRGGDRFGGDRGFSGGRSGRGGHRGY